MTQRDHLAIEGFRNDDGELYSSGTKPGWNVPRKVELDRGCLLFRWFPQELECAESMKLILEYRMVSNLSNVPKSYEETFKHVTPRNGLFEEFIDLTDKDDQTILKFAAHYGKLNVFYRYGYWSLYSEGLVPDPHVEFCSIYRYFSRLMLAILRLTDSLDRGAESNRSDWEAIGQLPSEMERLVDELENNKITSEKWSSWLTAARCFRPEELVRFSPDIYGDNIRGKQAVGAIVDHLLSLADIRIRCAWQPLSLRNTRPTLFYPGQGLFGYLVLQLCSLVAGQMSTTFCSHCNKLCEPRKRAPKRGQRNFCEACRNAGIRRKYSRADCLERQKKEHHGKTSK